MNAGRAILVCFAVPTEARAFRKLVRHRTDVRLLLTGIGRTNAEQSVSVALAQARFSTVLTCGFAGGLDPGLALGEVVFEADPLFPLASALATAAARRVQFWCADRVVVSRAEKRALRESTGADAVEMESAPIRRLCRERGIASATVRVISDVAGETLPLDFNRLLAPGMRMSYARLACALMRHPATVPALWRFQGRLNGAAQALTRVLAGIIPPV